MELLQRIVEIARNFLNNKKGQGLMEYALILSLVSVAAIAIMGILGIDIMALFTKVSGEF